MTSNCDNGAVERSRHSAGPPSAHLIIAAVQVREVVARSKHRRRRQAHMRTTSGAVARWSRIAPWIT